MAVQFSPFLWGCSHSSRVSPQHGCYCVTCLAGSGLKGKSANHRSRASLVPVSPEILYFVLSFKISSFQPSFLCLNRTEQNRQAVFLEGCRWRGDNGNTLGFNITSSEITRGVCPGERPTVCPFSAEGDILNETLQWFSHWLRLSCYLNNAVS